LVMDNLRWLEAHFVGLPVRHWLSAKTQPVRPLFEMWRKSQRGIEVVSGFELAAALAVGFDPNQILVNGVAKHSWLPEYSRGGLRVHFDSVQEVRQLRRLAAADKWRVGLRIAMPPGISPDPDRPGAMTQFGMSFAELQESIDLL